MMFDKNLLLLAMVSLVAGCSRNQHQHSIPMNQPGFMQPEKSQIEGELDFYYGGGRSKKFERALKGNYRMIKVTFISGTNSATLVPDRTAGKDYFVIGIKSSQAKAILEFLHRQRPWEWQSAEAFWEANNLIFNGNIPDRTWKYVSVYPDPKLESLLVQLRNVLESR